MGTGSVSPWSRRNGGYSSVINDAYAITITDDEGDPDERRFVTLGAGTKGRLLVVVYCYRGENIRIISARPAERHKREQYEVQR